MEKKELEFKVFKLADTLFFLLSFDNKKRVKSEIFNKILGHKICNNEYLSYKNYKTNIQKQINETKKKNYKKLYDRYKNKMTYYIHKVLRLCY